MRDDDFREFVRARSPALSRAAFLLTGDHHLAQDLLQTVLATTYQHWNRIRSGSPEAYVRRALHNTHISWWRRRHGMEFGSLDEAVAAGTAVVGVDDAADSTALRMTVVAALRALTARQRAVIVLRYFEDMTEVQAAEVLGCSVGTVKRLHFDAMARLRAVAPSLLSDGQEMVSAR